MTKAFDPGDPVLELAALGQGIPITVLETEDQPWIRKAEQLKIDEVCAFESNIFRIGIALRIEAKMREQKCLSCSRDSCNGSDLCLKKKTDFDFLCRSSMVHTADIIISSLARKARGNHQCF